MMGWNHQGDQTPATQVVSKSCHIKAKEILNKPKMSSETNSTLIFLESTFTDIGD